MNMRKIYRKVAKEYGVSVALFPVTLILTLLVAFARFFCLFSGMVLNVIAGALFLFGVLMLFIGEWHGFLGFAVLAWAISPYGLPGAAVWLTERVDDINSMLKAI